MYAECLREQCTYPLISRTNTRLSVCDQGTTLMTPCDNTPNTTRWCCNHSPSNAPRNATECCSAWPNHSDAITLPLVFDGHASTPSPSPSPSPSGGQSSPSPAPHHLLSGGAIAGVVIGSIAGAVLLGVLIYVIVKKRRDDGRKTEVPPYDDGTPDAAQI